MKEYCELFLIQVMKGEKKGYWLKPFLWVVSLFYLCVVYVRHFSYDKKLFRSYSLSVPVVSVGNVVLGGTGKTPVIDLLAKSLEEIGSIAILTRGFRSSLEKKGGVHLVSDGKGAILSAKECGDEPYLLAQNTKAAIWVGADRVASGKKAIDAGAKCLLLDDGMQHRRICRDVEIAVVDADSLFSKGQFFPCGLLRDLPSRLKKVDLVILNHSSSLSQLGKAKKSIRLYTQAPIVCVKPEVINPEKFSSKKVGVFCGIGHPERFIKTVRELNCEIVETLFIPDHCPIEEKRLSAFALKCREKGAEALLCTEKDMVKLESPQTVLEVIPVKIQLQIVEGRQSWETLIENILERIPR